MACFMLVWVDGMFASGAKGHLMLSARASKGTATVQNDGLMDSDGGWLCLGCPSSRMSHVIPISCKLKSMVANKYVICCSIES